MGRTHMEKRNIHKNGFTLLEFLIYTSVFTIVLLSILGILNITNNVRARLEAKTEVLRNAGFVTERINRLGKDADSFGSVVTTSAEFIQGGVTTTIYVTSSEFRIKEDASEENLIASVVLAEQVTSTEPIFKKIGNTIQMKLKLRYNDQGNPLYKYSTNVETTVTLR